MSRNAARFASSAWWSASVIALLAVTGVLLFVFFFVMAQGLPAFRPSLFTTTTNGIAGGLANAIVGTLLLVVIGVVIVAVVGFATAAWTVEFASPGARTFIRFCIDVLAGVPSVVVGYFLYVALVQTLGWGFSLLAGAFALAIIMLPYVVRGADLALSAVPRELREAAVALGGREAMVFFRIALPAAAPGALTGLLLATGIALGETAPLIYTAGWSNYLPTLAPTHSPVGYLTYVVWTFISQPFPQAHQLAYAAAALLMLFIFLINLVSRTVMESWGTRR